MEIDLVGFILVMESNFLSYRRKWMLAGFSAAILVGDLFLTFLKAGSDMDSAGYVIGVAGFALAQVFWTVGQLRESRPDWRVALALAIPLATFALVRLRPPVMPPAANAAVAAYSLLTALSFATALASRARGRVLRVRLAAVGAESLSVGAAH